MIKYTENRLEKFRIILSNLNKIVTLSWYYIFDNKIIMGNKKHINSFLYMSSPP